MSAAPWICGAIALGLALLLTPLVRRACVVLRIYDFPGPLKIHSQPIPRLGGIAIAVALATAVSAWTGRSNLPLWPFLIALGFTWATGLLDDLRGLSPSVRIVAQLAGASLLWHSGWRIPLAGNGIFSLVGTCLFVIVFVNAFNFLDGADGIAGGVAAIIALGYALLPVDALSGVGAAIAWTLVGVSCGFLAFNFPPAKIFMGDAGSTALGLGVAFLGLDFFRAGAATASQLPFPILVAALPLVDATLAVLRRLLGRVSPFYGDRRHFYDLLLARGSSVRAIALICYALTGALVIAASLARRAGFPLALIFLGLSVGALFAVAVKLGALRTRDENPGAEEVRT